MCVFHFKFGTSWHIFQKVRHEYYVTAGYPNVIIPAFLQSVKQYDELAIPKGRNETSIVRGVSSFAAVQLRSSPFRDVALHRFVGVGTVSEQRNGSIFKDHSR